MSQKVKSFLHIFKNSLIPQTLYYPKILRNHFVFSFKYYIVLLIILNLFFLISLPIKFNPLRLESVLSAVVASLKTYPADLKISIANGTMSTSYSRPYFLWLDYQNRKKLILVVDESATPEKFSVYNPMLLVTRREVVANFAKNNQISVLPLNILKNETIDSQIIANLTSILSIIDKFFFLIYLGIFLMLFVTVPIISFLVTTFYLALATLVSIFFFQLVKKKRLHFKKAFQVGLHAATLPLILDYFLIIFKPAIYMSGAIPTLISVSFPFLFLLLLFIFVFSGIYVAW